MTTPDLISEFNAAHSRHHDVGEDDVESVAALLQFRQRPRATSRDPAVRRFATQMVRDHMKSTADVKRAAARAGIVPPLPRLDAVGARNIARLRTTRGRALDKLYVQQQTQAHRMALELQRGYAARGAVRPLARTAATIAPVVQHHIGELSRM